MKAKDFAITTASIMGALLIAAGIVMVFKGINSFGTIDIKSTLISGRLATGSLGLLFTFLGVLVLVFVLRTRRETKVAFRKKSGEEETDWSRWESGDPYVDLMNEVFPDMGPPPDVKGEPIVDWISEEKVRQMVGSYLEKELRKRAVSFIRYHFRGKKNASERTIKEFSDLLESAFTEGDTVYQSQLEPGEREVRKILNETMYMIENTVKWFFTSKKRIFAGWDKYPVCYPPVHNELAKRLDGLEKEWDKKLDKARNLLRKTLLE